MINSTTIDPWDRQPRETSKAYEAFQVYLDLGAQRSTRKTAERLSKSEALINGWSAKHGWPDRARAWDSMPRKAVAMAYQEMAADIAAQHKELADKLMSRLKQNVDLLPAGADPSIKWSTAHNAARQGHAFAADLSKPSSTQAQEITNAIENLLNKLAGE